MQSLAAYQNVFTGLGEKVCPRLREWCRQAKAEVLSKSSNIIHQTWPKIFSQALYIGNPSNWLDGLDILQKNRFIYHTCSHPSESDWWSMHSKMFQSTFHVWMTMTLMGIRDKNNVGFVNKHPVNIPLVSWLSALHAVGLDWQNINRRLVLAMHIISVKHADGWEWGVLDSPDWHALIWMESSLSLHLYGKVGSIEPRPIVIRPSFVMPLYSQFSLLLRLMQRSIMRKRKSDWNSKQSLYYQIFASFRAD